MYETVKKEIKRLLKDAGVTGDISFTVPPNPEMGDLAFACFALAKERKENPAEVAKQLVKDLGFRISDFGFLDRVEAMGPYVNFFLNAAEVAKVVLAEVGEDGYGTHDFGERRKILVEFGCPNPMKAFHLGHLRNLITGESVARILENAGHAVVRINYQGDVGLHIPKTLWGIDRISDFRFQISDLTVTNFDDVRSLALPDRIFVLGKAYAAGATAYEESEKAQEEIRAYNEIMYGEREDERVMKIYHEARQWSLDYFETIYAKLHARFDNYYFESEMFRRAIELVKEGIRSGILKQSQGAVIFEGSKYGLHDRVFLNQKGYPTYESKDLALAERHFGEHHPNRIVHVVGKEQTEYFNVLFKALEFFVPESVGKEFHLVGGYLQLKGDVKMSSRKGNVITGDELIEAVEERIGEIMKESAVAEKETIKTAIAVAALKYTMLKSGVSDDISFDMESSVSTSGDSGPYLLYIVARIKSILRKSQITSTKFQTNPKSQIPNTIEQTEKQLLMKVSEFPDATKLAAETMDPSRVAKYLFELAQAFNTFYHACPVLQAEENVKQFRLQLISAVETVMTKGLYLLGIETVEEM